jgi:fatty acid desaturase
MRRVRKNVEPYDEKQDANMNKAAALSWLFSLVAAFFLYLLFREEVLAGLVWFPLLVFFAITAYAVSTLFLFIRN